MEVMKQIHKPYYTWECYKNGMFDIDKKQNEDLLIKKSVLVLSKWKNSTDNNLSNKNINRNSWIGQSACSYNHKCPELLTRIAWGNISELQRNKANNIAKKIIKIYEDKNRKIYTGLGKQMLFEWNT